MDELVQELIESKMKLAEAQESLLIKSQTYREISETYTRKQEDINKMLEEIQSLYDSISQISEERNALILLIEDCPRVGSILALDAVEDESHILEVQSSQSSSELWRRILVNWEKVKSLKRLKSLSRKGIDPSVRGQIWLKIIANRLHLTEILYRALASRGRIHDKDLEIPADLKKSLPTDKLDDLSALLESFFVIFIQNYRPDFQYSPVMAYLALVFSAYLPPFEAFVCYTNFVLNSEILRSFYAYNLPSLQTYYKIVQHYLEKSAPGILNKLQEFGMYLDNMIMENVCTYFAKCAPVEFVR